jgi:site-specific recombinase XerD
MHTKHLYHNKLCDIKNHAILCVSMGTLILEKNAFLKHLKDAKRSSATVENYDRYITRFLAHINATHPSEITEQSLNGFHQWLQTYKNKTTQRTLCTKTQNYHRTAVRSFLRYLREKGADTYQPEDIILKRDVNLFSQDVLTDDELRRMRETVNGRDSKSARDRAIFLMLICSGLRVSELCALKRNIDYTADTLLIEGKNNKTREVPLTAETKEALKTYLILRRDDDPALYVNNGKRTSNSGSIRLSSRSVQRIIQACAVRAGITKKITPHTLRYTFGKKLLEDGADTGVIQRMLGLTHRVSTASYVD